MPAAGQPGGAEPLQNSKHEAVAAAYLADPQRIGFRAYLVVFPQSSEKAARTAWSRLLKRADFSRRIAALKAKAADDSVMELREVLAELSKLGRSSIKKCIVGGDDTAEVITALRELPDDEAATIQELTIETYVEGGGEDAREVKRVKLKLHDKRGALGELRRHYEPLKLEHSGKDGKPIETKDVSEKLTDIEAARRIAFFLTQAAMAPKEASDGEAVDQGRDQAPGRADEEG